MLVISPLEPPVLARVLDAVRPNHSLKLSTNGVMPA